MIFEAEGKNLSFKMRSVFYTIFSIKSPFFLKHISKDGKFGLKGILSNP